MREGSAGGFGMRAVLDVMAIAQEDVVDESGGVDSTH
jgi:hypothetical protein